MSKLFKRVISLTLAVSFIVGMLSINAWATDKPTVTIGSVTTDNGGTVKVPVSIEGNTGFGAFSITFAINEKLAMSSTTPEKGEVLAQSTGSLTRSKMKLSYTDVTSTTNYSGDGILFYVFIEAPETNGIYSISAPASNNNKAFGKYVSGSITPENVPVDFVAGKITVGTPSPAANPNATFTATGDNAGTLGSVTDKMQYKYKDETNWTAVPTNATTVALTDILTSSQTSRIVQVQQPGSDADFTTDSEIQTITIEKATAPSGLTATAASAQNANDGKITGVTTGMQYKGPNDTEFTNCSGTEIAGLAPGTYQVRTKWNGNKLSSDATDVTVPYKEAKPKATFTADGADSGTLTNVSSGMQYSIDGGDTWVDISDTSVRIESGVKADKDIQVKKPGTSPASVDSDVQTIDVTQAVTPKLTATQPDTINGTGSIPTTTEHQQSTDNINWVDSVNGWSDLAPGTYYVRVKATGQTLESEAQSITIYAYTAPKETTPNATFTATSENTATLSGLVAGGKYAVTGAQPETFTLDDSTTEQNLTGVSEGTVTLVKKGNGTTTIDSDAQTIDITKAEMPSLTANQPTVRDGNGSIPTTTAHQQSTDGTTWTDSVNGWSDLAPGTYYVRTKATGKVLASDAQTIVIKNLEETPSATFTATGYDTGTLSGLVSGGSYKVSGMGITTDAEFATISGTSISLEGLNEGKLSIVKKGNGSSTVDSAAQELTIGREATPTVTGEDAPPANGKGKLIITGASDTDKFEYKTKDASDWTGATEFTGAQAEVDPGTYVVRKIAAGKLYSEPSTEVKVKGTLPAPQAVFTGTDEDEGTLSNLINGQEYQVSGAGITTAQSFTASGTTHELTGLTDGTLSIVSVGDGDTTTSSNAQTIAIPRPGQPNITAIQQPDATHDKGSITIETTHQIKKGENGAWGTTSTELEGDTYYVRVKPGEKQLASPAQTIVIKSKNDRPSATFTGTDKDKGTLSDVTDKMKYKVDNGDWQTISGTTATVSGLTNNSVIKVYEPGVDAENTVDSAEQPITVTKPDAPTTATATDCTKSENKDGKLTGVDDTMEYQKSDANSWTPVESGKTEVTGLTNGTYYVRVKAGVNQLASDNKEVIIKGMEATPDATFTATGADSGTLANVESGMKYSLDGGTNWTDISDTTATIASSVTATKGIQVKQPATNVTMQDSDVQSITVKQAAKPKLEETQPSVIGGKGSIPTTTAHEYKTGSATEWTPCTGRLDTLSAGTYFVRVKADGQTLASEAQDITIKEYEAPKATQPRATFTATGADSGKLTNVESGMKYSLDGGHNWANISGTTATIASGVTTNGIKVMQSGNGTTTTDSDAQTIDVTQATTPVTTATDCKSEANNDGKISEVTTSMEYKKSDANDWTDCASATVTGLTPGTYYVREKASGNKLASVNQELTIAAYHAPDQVAAPTFSPAAGSYVGKQTVTITCATDDATIYYTTDGAEPTKNSTEYETPISVTETTTIKAFATKTDLAGSSAASAKYTISKAEPVLTVTAPTFTKVYTGYAQPAAAALTITNAGNSMATISSVALSGTNASDFTLNTTDSTTIDAGATNSSTYTVQPNAGLAKGTYTATVTVTYDGGATATADVSFRVLETSVVPTPTFSPAGGTFTSTQSVTISCEEKDAVIYYTTDGSTPTKESTKYSSAIRVENTTTIKAIAIAEGMTDSEAAQATYTINKSNDGDNGGNNGGNNGGQTGGQTGGGSGGGAPAATTVTIPVSGEGKNSETAKVTVSVSGNTATVTSADVSNVLSAKDVGNVTVDLSSLNSTVDEVVLPAALVENVSKAVNDESNDAKALEVKLPSGDVTLDAKALATITEQAAGKDVKLHLDNVSQATLTSKQQDTVKDMTDAKVVDVYLTAGDNRISNFNGGTATLTVPYKLKADQKAEGVVGWYVAEDGTKTEVACTYGNEKAYVEAPHLSNYVIAYDASRVKSDEPEPQPEPTPVTPTDIGYDSLSDKEKKQADQVSKALSVDKDIAAQMVKGAAKLGVSIDTLKLGTETVLALKDDADPKGADFGKLTARVTKRTNSALTIKWAKQKNADGYLVYGNLCGKKYKLLKTIDKSKTVSYTQKKLKKGKYNKYMVVAYKNVSGQKMPIAASVVIHAPTKGGKTTVAKSVKLSKTKVSVKKGKSVTVKATEVLEEKKLKLKTHRAVKYESSNAKIATVNAKGKITGKKKGKATIYVYTQNGTFAKVAVTVK